MGLPRCVRPCQTEGLPLDPHCNPLQLGIKAAVKKGWGSPPQHSRSPTPSADLPLPCEGNNGTGGTKVYTGTDTCGLAEVSFTPVLPNRDRSQTGIGIIIKQYSQPTLR